MSEELQRYLVGNKKKLSFRGEPLGKYQWFVLGSTTVSQLKSARIIADFTTEIKFKPKLWKGKPSPATKPDEIVLDERQCVLVVERKDSVDLRTQLQEEAAAEQCLTYIQQLGAKLGVVTDYQRFLWIHNLDDASSEVRYVYDEDRPFSADYRTPGTIESVLAEIDPVTDTLSRTVPINPASLADSVWQTIWLATHEEPKLCLATFVEIFLYKFLSDLGVLPGDLHIERLNIEEGRFLTEKGKTQLEFYVEHVRPALKKLFPEKEVSGALIDFIPGSPTTSIIDGFAFIDPSVPKTRSLASFNHSFLDIIRAFINFGPIGKIDSDFKSRVYEKFLKKSVKQQKLGQHLTPRNIVRAIVGMARPGELSKQNGAVLCDPACGVGGFLLEPLLREEGLKDNLKIDGTKVSWKVQILGLEVDRQINILSKANMLIHLAEKYRGLSSAARQSFADLMNRSFLLLDHDRMLGSLEFPLKEEFDLVLTNPPYVVKGTKVIRQKIAQMQSLKEYFKGSGIGTESLFLRYIVESLKPGGRAFVIVPTGLLTRSETAVRGHIREHCILDAVISLPERTFYNTPNRTYILCFTAKSNPSQVQTAPVLAYLVREVGEMRDAWRFPCRSDLPDLVRQFRAFQADKEVFEPRNLNCKLVPISELSASERWDVDRFWTDLERRELGLGLTSAISVDQFESDLESTVESVNFEIEQLRSEVPSEPKYMEVQLGDARFFHLIRGQRVTKENINSYPGNIPVISGHGEAESYLGFVSDTWLGQQGIVIHTTPLITVNANGSVGDVFLRTEPKYVIHDDVIGIDVVNSSIDPLYAVYAIRESVAKARFRYDAKLYQKRLRPLSIRVPVNEKGDFDVQQQQVLASQYERLETLKASIRKFSDELEDRFITVDFRVKTPIA